MGVWGAVDPRAYRPRFTSPLSFAVPIVLRRSTRGRPHRKLQATGVARCPQPPQAMCHPSVRQSPHHSRTTGRSTPATRRSPSPPTAKSHITAEMGGVGSSASPSHCAPAGVIRREPDGLGLACLIAQSRPSLAHRDNCGRLIFHATTFRLASHQNLPREFFAQGCRIGDRACLRSLDPDS